MEIRQFCAHASDNDEVTSGKIERARRCEISGCESFSASYLAAKSLKTLKVCRRCAQELKSLYGWSVGRLETVLTQS